MSKLFALLALVALVTADPTFSEWKALHGKKYHSAEEDAIRHRIYLQNVENVRQLNIKAQTPGSGLEGEFGVNAMSDLTWDEVKALYLQCYSAQASTGRETYAEFNARPPASVDWRTSNPPVVTDVKDQGQCGSCWAFATTGTTEGAYAIAKKAAVVSLSEQDEVDCSKKQHNMGCNGGRVDWGLDYIKAAKGINTAESYPYKAKDGSCQHKPSPIGATISAYTRVKTKNESDLANAISQAPVGVAICVTNAWANYKSGVFYDSSCKSGEFDLSHAVLAVGYGTDSGKDYFIVKNSWGQSWGASGYILMARNRNNNCGISTDAYWPQI